MELERAQLAVKLKGCWCGALVYADDVVLVVHLKGGAAGYVGYSRGICVKMEDEV